MFAILEMPVNPVIPIHLKKFVLHLINMEKCKSTFLMQNRTLEAAGVEVAVECQALFT